MAIEEGTAGRPPYAIISFEPLANR